MPDERTRALLWAGSLLIDIAQDNSLPLSLRHRAIIIARHFPTIEDVSWMAVSSGQSAFNIQIARPQEVLLDMSSVDFTPLRHSTKLKWPEE